MNFETSPRLSNIQTESIPDNPMMGKIVKLITDIDHYLNLYKNPKNEY